MARIRSIKIGFFKNELLAELGAWHRLLFAGLWPLADREGRLEDRPRRIKAEVFPYDTEGQARADGAPLPPVDHMLDELAAKGFIARYTADGAAYLAIVNFLRHQRPKSDEAASLIPAPPFEIPRGIVAAPRQGRGSGKGVRDLGRGEGPGADGASEHSADGADPARSFQQAWNDTTQLPIPRCVDLTAKRRRHIRTRLTEHPLTEWVEAMRRLQASRFCRGEVPGRDGRDPFRATFDWFIGSPDVIVKLREGAYDDRDTPAAGVVLVEPAPDWYAECQSLHGGACGLDRHRHHTQKLLDATRPARRRLA